MASAMTRCDHAGSGHLQPERCPHAKEVEHGWLRAPFLRMAALGHFACQRDGCPVGTEPALRLPGPPARSSRPAGVPAPHAVRPAETPGRPGHGAAWRAAAPAAHGRGEAGGRRRPGAGSAAASDDGGRVRERAAPNSGCTREETSRNGGRTREGCHVGWLREGRGIV